MRKLKYMLTICLTGLLMIAPTAAHSSVIESLGAAADIKFFEAPSEGVPFEARAYSTGFEKQSTRFVSYELRLELPAPGTVVEIPLTIRYLNFDGSLFHELNHPIVIQPDSIRPWYSWGAGWRDPGKWTPGIYTVEVLENDEEIVSADFTVYSDREAADTLFDWLDVQLPELLAPRSPSTIMVDNWYYRYYADTNAYVATFQGEFYYLDRSAILYDLGRVNLWLSYVGSGTPKPFEQTRMSAADALMSNNYEDFKNIFSKNLPVPVDAPDPPYDIAQKVGRAIKDANLKYSSEYYAFYEMTIDGKRYPLTFVQEEEGIWKIDQF